MKKEINVVMVQPDDPTIEAKMSFTQGIIDFVYFGREMKITPKANACINKGGYKAEYFVPTVTVTIGIGNDHTAELIMTEEAWKEFYYNNAEISIDTVKEFNDKFIRTRKNSSKKKIIEKD
jgi:hypothetical protein